MRYVGYFRAAISIARSLCKLFRGGQSLHGLREVLILGSKLQIVDDRALLGECWSYWGLRRFCGPGTFEACFLKPD